jgi:hypothetical protein
MRHVCACMLSHPSLCLSVCLSVYCDTVRARREEKRNVLTAKLRAKFFSTQGRGWGRKVTQTQARERTRSRTHARTRTRAHTHSLTRVHTRACVSLSVRGVGWVGVHTCFSVCIHVSQESTDRVAKSFDWPSIFRCPNARARARARTHARTPPTPLSLLSSLSLCRSLSLCLTLSRLQTDPHVWRVPLQASDPHIQFPRVLVHHHLMESPSPHRIDLIARDLAPNKAPNVCSTPPLLSLSFAGRRRRLLVVPSRLLIGFHSARKHFHIGGVGGINLNLNVLK